LDKEKAIPAAAKEKNVQVAKAKVKAGWWAELFVPSKQILNAAGRNSTISLVTHDGHLRQNAVVGLILFL
jgi:hypothetical protein